MQITITLPDAIAIEMRNGVTDSLNVAALSADIIARGAVMGLAQKTRNFAASALMNCRVRAAGAQGNDESDDAYAKRLEKITVSTEDLAAESAACIRAGIERLAKGDWGAERTAGPGLDRGLIDFVIAELAPAFMAQVPAFKDAKLPERRTIVNDWLDAKPDRRASWAAKHDAAKVEAEKAAKVSLQDM